MKRKKKTTKRQKRNKYIVILSVILVVALMFLGYLLWSKNMEKEAGENNDTIVSDENESAPFQEINTSAGITIFAVENYIGQYIEDGSDEVVENVLSLKVRNDGDQPIQLADIIVSDNGQKEYVFRITTLLPGDEMLVLEQNRAEYSEEMQIISARVENYAVFDEEPGLQTDVFEIQCDDNAINVKNISDKSISAGRICYKSMLGEMYLGGITYTVSIPALEPGAEVQLPAMHYYEETSKVVFVTYAE